MMHPTPHDLLVRYGSACCHEDMREERLAPHIARMRVSASPSRASASRPGSGAFLGYHDHSDVSTSLDRVRGAAILWHDDHAMVLDQPVQAARRDVAIVAQRSP